DQADWSLPDLAEDSGCSLIANDELRQKSQGRTASVCADATFGLRFIVRRCANEECVVCTPIRATTGITTARGIGEMRWLSRLHCRRARTRWVPRANRMPRAGCARCSPASPRATTF